MCLRSLYVPYLVLFLQLFVGLELFSQTNSEMILERLRNDPSSAGREEMIEFGFNNRFDSPVQFILPLRSRIGLPSTEGQVLLKAKLYNLLGLLYRNIGLPDSAAKNFLASSSHYSRHDKSRFNSAEYNLMNLHTAQLNDPAEALNIGKNLIGKTRNSNDVPNLIMTMDALAQAYWKLDSVETALRTVKKGLDLSRNQAVDSVQYWLLYRKAALYSCYLPEYLSLSLMYLDSAQWYVESGCHDSATFLSLKGEVLQMNGMYSEALEALSEAESLQVCFDSPSALEAIYYRTYSVALDMDNETVALEYIVKYDSIRSIILDEAKVTVINNFKTLYETEKK